MSSRLDLGTTLALSGDLAAPGFSGKTWHMVADGGRSSCGRVIVTTAITAAATVSAADRCGGPGCRRRWPTTAVGQLDLLAAG